MGFLIVHLTDLGRNVIELQSVMGGVESIVLLCGLHIGMLVSSLGIVLYSLCCGLQELDLESLLLSIHEFFVDLGVEEIRRRGAEDDKPLRMVKTILHELCKIKVACRRFCFWTAKLRSICHCCAMELLPT